VAEATTRRVYLPDVRGNDQYLRATWHPETAVVVVSHWVGEVCVASTPVGVADLSNLIGLLVSALQDTATPLPLPRASMAPAAPPRGLVGLAERLRARLRPTLAQVITLRRPVRDQAEAMDRQG
jgi:hypothetical protein